VINISFVTCQWAHERITKLIDGYGDRP